MLVYPKGYTGIVIIIFNQKNGVPPEIENGKHIYRIPSSGLSETQVNANYNVQKNEYYYIDARGEMTAIPYAYPKGWPKKNADTLNSTNSIFCYNEEMGATAINKPDYKKYRLFFVGKLEQLDSLSNIRTKVLFKALNQK